MFLNPNYLNSICPEKPPRIRKKNLFQKLFWPFTVWMNCHWRSEEFWKQNYFFVAPTEWIKSRVRNCKIWVCAMAFANLFNFMNNVNRAATPIHSFLGSIFRWCQCPQGTGVYWAMRKYLWLQSYKLNVFAHYMHWNFPFSLLKYSLVPNLRESLITPFENPQRWMGQNTFPILLLNDDNMIGEH